MAGGARGSAWGIFSLGKADDRAGSRSFCAPARPGRRAELQTVFLVATLICLSGLVWAQKPIAPQTMASTSSSRPAGSIAAPSNRVGERYVIAKDDVLSVDVEGVQELSRDYRVGADGMISLPMLSRPVLAEGRTLEELSEAIGKDLVEAGLLKDPHVIVTVKSSPWNTVVLSGAAKKPGLYPVFGHMTMLELLTLAEGLTDDAGNTAIITRGPNAPQSPGPGTGQAVENAAVGNATVENANAVTSHTVKVNVWQLWQNGDASLDVDLYPGDRVMVKRASIVYIVGAVNRAGAFVLNDEEPMTLISAMAVSLGYTNTAKTSKALIIRKDPRAPGGREQIPVDLKKVFTLRAPDQQLVANDILFVPESGGKRALENVTGNLISSAVYSGVWRVPY